MLVANEGTAFTVATTAVRVVELHPPLLASAQYVVVAEIEGVVNELPVPSAVPPEDAANQLITPALAVADNVTVPVPQREAPADVATVGI